MHGKIDELVGNADALDLNSSALDEDRLVIALDFGTTFSGIAYSFCSPGKKPEVVPIVDWPGLEGRKQPKVPTIISYDPKDPSKFKWGGQLTWRDAHVQGVKLLLDPDQPKPMYLPSGSIKSEIKKLPKKPVDIAADFIGAIYGHAIEKIESKVPRDYVSICQKHFVLSVPAVWSDQAKDRTLQAAKKAGIHPVTPIKEPEAAALHTLMSQERALSVGDCFILCDAGGGTVDLISYEVVALRPALALKEVVPGTGNMAGSLGLNKRFGEAVQNLVGEEEWIRLKKLPSWAKAAREFDLDIKTAFQGDLEDEYIVNFPGAELEDVPEEGLKRDSWFMSGHVVQGIFQPLIHDIVRLVDEQVKSAMLERDAKPVRGIFLVGGFGSSQFLKSSIEKANRGIQMKWYIKIGHDLERDQDVRFPFYTRILADYSPDELIFKTKLQTSDLKTPPIHPTSDIKENCTLTSNLQSVDKSLFKGFHGLDGKEYVDIDYNLVISMKDAAMRFWLEFDGKEAGSIDASYE
ncbi:hypothetical protein ACJ41O_014649 [Fusarium nematophilum]